MPATITPTNPAKAPRLPTGQQVQTELGGAYGEKIVAELHGKYATQTLGGNMYHGLSAVGGAAVPIANTTSPVCVLWNQAGSGVNVVLASLSLGYVSGTAAPGALHLGFSTGAGSSVATGAVFTAFTHVDPICGIIGNAYDQAGVRWAPATATLTAAGTQGPVTGLSWLTTTATATDGFNVKHVDFDGRFVIKPGVAVYPLAVAASVTLFTICLSFYIVPAASANG